MTVSKHDIPPVVPSAKLPRHNALEAHAQDCFELLVKGSSYRILDRINEILGVLHLDSTQSIEQRAENLELFITELSRAIRGAELGSTITPFLERVQLELDLPSPQVDDGEREPLELIARRVMDNQLIVGLPDRMYEVLLPVIEALISVRGFIHGFLEPDELDELAQQKALTELREEIQGQRAMVDRRIKVGVAGLLSEVERCLATWRERRKLPPSEKRKSLQRAQGAAEKTAENYERAMVGTFGALEAEVEIWRTEVQVRSMVEGQVLAPAQRVKEDLVQNLDLLMRSLRASHQRIQNALEGDDLSPVADSIKAQRDTIQQKVTRSTLPLIREMLQEVSGTYVVESLRLDLQRIANNLPERIELLSRWEIDALRDGVLPDHLASRAVRAPGISILGTTLPLKVALARDRVKGLLTEMHDQVQKVEGVAVFNLDTALKELNANENEEEIKIALEELAGGALERAEEMLAPLLDHICDISDEAIHGLKSDLDRNLKNLQFSVVGAAGESAEEKPADRFFDGIRESLKKSVDALQIALSSSVQWVWQKTRRAAIWIQRTLGGKKSTALPAGVADPEKTGRARESSLPRSYRVLFSSDPVPSRDLLIGRDEALAKISTALVRIHSGNPASLAVVGVPGSGRSSLVRLARNTVLDGISTHLISLEHGTTELELTEALGRRLGVHGVTQLADLIAPLERRTNTCVVILDDLGHLFRRKPGGMKTLENLRLLISSTSTRVLWIATISEPLWRFLMQMGRIPQAFVDVVLVEPLSVSETASVIASRHALSGYNLSFANIPLRRRLEGLVSAGVLEERPEFKSVAKTLRKFSEGNPGLAVLIWRRSLELSSEGHLRVDVPEKPMVMPIVEEDLDSHATLTTILLEGSITAETHAEVFGWDLEKSKRVLLGLQQRGWIVRISASASRTMPRYRLIRSVRVPLYNFLQERGMLP